MKNLGKFISIAPYEEAQMICNNKIDTVLLSRKCNTGPQYEECYFLGPLPVNSLALPVVGRENFESNMKSV